MIQDLPKEFPLDAIALIDFGDAEARDDNLLPQCAIQLPVFREITTGKKDIVHGYRGTGKSSLVRLLQEKTVKFEEEPGFTSHILVIDEELSYRAVRDYLNRQITHGTSPELLLRIVWDILICYRAMKYVQDEIGGSDSTLRENINEVEVLFGISKPKTGLMELLLSQKKKVGVKLDSNLPSIVDMYAAIEPNAPRAESAEISVLKIADHARYLARYLKERKITLYVLLDRLDDFVVQEDYETQRALLQQLLACQADYRSKFGQGRIRLFAFLRTDLFLRIDLNPLGPDKIAQRSVEIKWTPQAIRQFLAKRLATNLLHVLKKQSLTLEIEEARFWITREEIAQLEETKATLKDFNLLNHSHWQKLVWLIKVVRRKSTEGARVSSFSDAYSESLITTLFPRVIFHRTLDGSEREIDLFQFLESHFELGYGQPNPRALLLFCAKALLVAQQYHQENPDLRLGLSDKGQYFLFNKKHIPRAYAMFQEDMWNIQVQLASSYKSLLACLNSFRSREKFSFRAFMNSCNVQDDLAKQFLGFCTHTGLLRCTNPQAPAVERDYQIPIMFQKSAKSVV